MFLDLIMNKLKISDSIRELKHPIPLNLCNVKRVELNKDEQSGFFFYHLKLVLINNCLELTVKLTQLNWAR
jgi:hypothetical protein